MHIRRATVRALLFAALLSNLTSLTYSAQGERPQMEISPSGEAWGDWLIIKEDDLKLTVTSSDATRIRVLYRPVAAGSRRIELKNVTPDKSQQKHTIDLKLTPEFCGEVWAEISESTKVQITRSLFISRSSTIKTPAGELLLDSTGGTLGSDESERSDKFTNGDIYTGTFTPGDPRIWITVNIPAFKLTLWQSGREVKSYRIGVGRKDFPLPSGERMASEIVWNPEWIPPDSKWVLESGKVKPGEIIKAEDPRNPIGKMKIRLGGSILIHQAAKVTDLGGLVSHGCVRMLLRDLYDLSDKIIAARNIEVSSKQIQRARVTKKRYAVKLDPVVWVDINYDTQVVEDGKLHLYPDVYGRGTNTLERLQDELASSGVDTTKIDPKVLRQAMRLASARSSYSVTIANLMEGKPGVAPRRRRPAATQASTTRRNSNQ
jgi:hypothetical protein